MNVIHSIAYTRMKNWMNEWYWMEWVPSHSIPSIFYKTKQWNITLFHSIPFHSTTFHQSKHSLKKTIPDHNIFLKRNDLDDNANEEIWWGQKVCGFNFNMGIGTQFFHYKAKLLKEGIKTGFTHLLIMMVLSGIKWRTAIQFFWRYWSKPVFL